MARPPGGEGLDHGAGRWLSRFRRRPLCSSPHPTSSRHSSRRSRTGRRSRSGAACEVSWCRRWWRFGPAVPLGGWAGVVDDGGEVGGGPAGEGSGQLVLEVAAQDYAGVVVADAVFVDGRHPPVGGSVQQGEVSEARPAREADLPPQARLDRCPSGDRVRRPRDHPPRRKPDRLVDQALRPHHPPLPHRSDPRRQPAPHRPRPAPRRPASCPRRDLNGQRCALI